MPHITMVDDTKEGIKITGLNGQTIGYLKLEDHNSNQLFAIDVYGLQTRNYAEAPGHYAQDINWANKGSGAAADRRTLTAPNKMSVNINSKGYFVTSQSELDLNSAGSWDTTTPTDYTVAATRGGKDFYIYACQPVSGIIPVILVSASSTFPSGYNVNTSRKIGGLHCEYADVGTIAGHDLTDYIIGDIIPASIWNLRHRPVCSPEGQVYDEKINKWVDIYLASGIGASTASVAGGTISDSRNWMDFVDDGHQVKKRLPTDEEFQSLAAGSNEKTNIRYKWDGTNYTDIGSNDPVIAGGHKDSANRRMISNIGCEGCCGVMWQWLNEQSYRLDGGTIVLITASQITTVTHDAAPGGNQVYLKYDNGQAYLACNMAIDTEDKIITFGTDYKVVIKHDANAAVGGLAVYFDDDGTQPDRLLANNTILSKDCYIETNNPKHLAKIKHDANANANGSALHFDDGGDERLESTCAGAANADIDLALLSFSDPSWGYYDLPGVKGSLYRQGTYGDIKLRAGGAWDGGSSSGSQARSANGYRWRTASAIGARFLAEPKETSLE